MAAAFNEISCACSFDEQMIINNTIFVDSVHGNDATGQRLQSNLPFSTLSAAVAASQPADRIVVRPGIYANEVIEANVQFDFALGTQITDCIFNDIFVIRGFGIFTDCLFNGSGMVYSRDIHNSQFVTNNNTFIRCTSLTRSNAGAIMNSNGGIAHLKADIINCQSQIALGVCIIEADYINTSAPVGFAGDISLHARAIDYLGSGVLFSDGIMNVTVDRLFSFSQIVESGNQFTLHARVIQMNVGNEIVFNSLTNGQMVINADRIIYNTTGTLFQADGNLTINSIIVPAQPQVMQNFLVAFERITINSSNLVIDGAVNVPGTLYINAENITTSALITTSGAAFISATNFTPLQQAFALNGGELSVNIKNIQGVSTLLLDATSGQFRFAVDKLTTSATVLNISGTTVGEFGGVWTTSAPTLITVSGTPTLTILSSKFVSTGNFITCAMLTDVYVMPTISRQSGLMANFIPAGALFVNAGIV